MPEEAKTAEEKDWTTGFSDEIKKDPEGWAAWLKSIRSSAKSRDALQEDQLHHVMEMVTRNWKWTAPTKISKAQIVDRLGNLSSWGSQMHGPAQSMLSTALEDILIVIDNSNKSRLENDEGGSAKKSRTNASGAKLLEQHCLRTGGGMDR